MSRKPFNPSAAGDEDNENPSGLSMVDVLALPDVEQRLVKWMMRQKDVSLAEIAAYMEQDEESLVVTLNALKEQGFVQELKVDEEIRYRPCLAAKQRSRDSKNLWQSLDF